MKANTNTTAITNSEADQIRFLARCCARRNRTEKEMLSQIRRNHGWRDDKESLAIFAFRGLADNR